MTKFLIDENLPASVGKVFSDLGYKVEYVAENFNLRSASDEVIFDYAVKQQAIIVTRDLNIANLVRFPLYKADGIVVLRFPQEVSMTGLQAEVKRIVSLLEDKDFHQIIIIEPGAVRVRSVG